VKKVDTSSRSSEDIGKFNKSVLMRLVLDMFFQPRLFDLERYLCSLAYVRGKNGVKQDRRKRSKR